MGGRKDIFRENGMWRRVSFVIIEMKVLGEVNVIREEIVIV